MKEQHNTGEKALVFRTKEGDLVFSTFSTSTDAERASKEMATQGATQIGAMSVDEAKDLVSEQRISPPDDPDRRHR